VAADTRIFFSFTFQLFVTARIKKTLLSKKATG
jgi:hypothetical protein